MKKVYISGYNGKIGKNLVDILKKEQIDINFISREHLMLKERLTISKTDYSQRILLHLAWPVQAQDYRSSEQNNGFLKISMNFLKEYAKSFDLFIFPGTIFELPENLAELTDQTKPEPRCKYSEAKMNLHDWVNQTGIMYSWPILPYIVSSNDPPFKLVPQILESLENINTPMELKSPYIRRNFLHVSECAVILAKCMNAEISGRYLIGSDTSVSPAELVREFGLDWRLNSQDRQELDIEQSLILGKAQDACIGIRTESEQRSSVLKRLILKEYFG